MRIGAKTCRNVHATFMYSDRASIFVCHRWWLGVHTTSSSSSSSPPTYPADAPGLVVQGGRQDDLGVDDDPVAGAADVAGNDVAVRRGDRGRRLATRGDDLVACYKKCESGYA